MLAHWLSALKTVLLATLLLFPARGLAEPPPGAYSARFVTALLGRPMTLEVRRDGSKELVDESTQPTPESPAGWHQRNLYDFAVSAIYVEPEGPGGRCSVERISGDNSDVFDNSAEILQLLAQANPKRLGTETVNGFPTQILQVSDLVGQGPGKLWFDERDGLLVKWVAQPASGPEKVIWELQSLTRARPDPAIFVLPAACASLPAPVSPEQEIANDTGGKVGQYLDAKIGPATKDHCQVVFKVVQKGSQPGALQPVMSGFQVAVDTAIETPGTEFHTDMDQSGIAKFSGGHVREMTNLVRNGLLHLGNPPESFQVSVNFPHGYDVDGPIFRRCFGPKTTLLLLVDANRKPLHWLWVTTPE